MPMMPWKLSNPFTLESSGLEAARDSHTINYLTGSCVITSFMSSGVEEALGKLVVLWYNRDQKELAGTLKLVGKVKPKQ